MATKYDADQLAAAAAAAGWSGREVPIAVAVALAESGGRMVTNDSIGETPSSRRGIERCASYGPWQINYCPGRDAGSARERAAKSTDLQLHANVAHSIYAQQGWNAWTMYRNGGYKRFLSVAEEASPSDLGARARGAVVGGLVGGIPGAVAGGTLGPSAEQRLGEGGLIARWGQIGGGTLLVLVGLVIIFRDIAPDVALGAVTGGGSLAAEAAASAIT